MLAAFATWLVTVVLDIAGGSFVGAALIVAIPIVITVGLSMAASRLLAPKMPSMGDLNDRGIMTRSPTSPRQIIYGQAKVSGTVVYLATSGTKNEYLHIVVALAGHEVQEIGEVYFNEDLVLTGSGDGYATGKYAASGSYTGSLIHKHLGSTTQTVDTTLQTDFAVDWDSNHRLRGIAYIYCKLTFSNEIFVGGIPNISCVVKGKKFTTQTRRRPLTARIPRCACAIISPTLISAWAWTRVRLTMLRSLPQRLFATSKSKSSR